jgi:hypothetical protein
LEGLPASSATFEDISIGRRLWVRMLQNPEPAARLDAIAIQIFAPGRQNH